MGDTWSMGSNIQDPNHGMQLAAFLSLLSIIFEKCWQWLSGATGSRYSYHICGDPWDCPLQNMALWQAEPKGYPLEGNPRPHTLKFHPIKDVRVPGLAMCGRDSWVCAHKLRALYCVCTHIRKEFSLYLQYGLWPKEVSSSGTEFWKKEKLINKRKMVLSHSHFLECAAVLF